MKDLNPKLIYLVQLDTYETIKRVAEERVSSDKSQWPDWIDRVISYIEDSQYGRKHGLKGFDGVVAFFEARKKIELAVIDKLPVNKVVQFPFFHAIKQVYHVGFVHESNAR